MLALHSCHCSSKDKEFSDHLKNFFWPWNIDTLAQMDVPILLFLSTKILGKRWRLISTGNGSLPSFLLWISRTSTVSSAKK